MSTKYMLSFRYEGLFDCLCYGVMDYLYRVKLILNCYHKSFDT